MRHRTPTEVAPVAFQTDEDSAEAAVEHFLRARGVDVDKNGRFSGPCPWCGSVTGDFLWDPSRGIFHCSCLDHGGGGRTKDLADRLPSAVCLADVAPESVESIFGGRIHFGKINLLEGDPGLGKSLICADLAARLSRGLPMPDDSPGTTGATIFLTAEDGLGGTLRPRLEAAGADLTRIFAIQAVADEDGERHPDIEADAERIENEIIKTAARLVIIDPLMAYLGPNTNSFRDQDVRRALAPLVAVAQRTRAALLVVRHLNKKTDGSPIYRGGGSIAFIAAARSGLLVAQDPHDCEKRVLAGVKNNLAPMAPSLSYRLESTDTGTSVAIDWLGTTEHTAASLLAVMKNGSAKPRALDRAKDLLQRVLADGPVRATEVEAEARNADVSKRTLQRAKGFPGIEATKEGLTGHWFWTLPSTTTGGGLHENTPPDDLQARENSEDRQGRQAVHADHLGGLRGRSDAEEIR